MPNNTNLGPAHRHIPLCVGTTDLYSVYIDKCGAPSRSRLNDLAAWLRAFPTGIGLTRQLQLFIGMAKLFFDFCWISRLRNVLERRFDADTRQRPRTTDSTKLNTLRLVQIITKDRQPLSLLTAKGLQHCAGRFVRSEAECCLG